MEFIPLYYILHPPLNVEETWNVIKKYDGKLGSFTMPIPPEYDQYSLNSRKSEGNIVDESDFISQSSSFLRTALSEKLQTHPYVLVVADLFVSVMVENIALGLFSPGTVSFYRLESAIRLLLVISSCFKDTIVSPRLSFLIHTITAYFHASKSNWTEAINNLHYALSIGVSHENPPVFPENLIPIVQSVIRIQKAQFCYSQKKENDAFVLLDEVTTDLNQLLTNSSSPHLTSLFHSATISDYGFELYPPQHFSNSIFFFLKVPTIPVSGHNSQKNEVSARYLNENRAKENEDLFFIHLYTSTRDMHGKQVFFEYDEKSIEKKNKLKVRRTNSTIRNQNSPKTLLLSVHSHQKDILQKQKPLSSETDLSDSNDDDSDAFDQSFAAAIAMKRSQKQNPSPSPPKTPPKSDTPPNNPIQPSSDLDELSTEAFNIFSAPPRHRDSATSRNSQFLLVRLYTIAVHNLLFLGAKLNKTTDFKAKQKLHIAALKRLVPPSTPLYSSLLHHNQFKSASSTNFLSPYAPRLFTSRQPAKSKTQSRPTPLQRKKQDSPADISSKQKEKKPTEITQIHEEEAENDENDIEKPETSVERIQKRRMKRAETTLPQIFSLPFSVDAWICGIQAEQASASKEARRASPPPSPNETSARTRSPHSQMEFYIQNVFTADYRRFVRCLEELRPPTFSAYGRSSSTTSRGSQKNTFGKASPGGPRYYPRSVTSNSRSAGRTAAPPNTAARIYSTPPPRRPSSYQPVSRGGGQPLRNLRGSVTARGRSDGFSPSPSQSPSPPRTPHTSQTERSREMIVNSLSYLWDGDQKRKAGSASRPVPSRPPNLRASSGNAPSPYDPPSASPPASSRRNTSRYSSFDSSRTSVGNPRSAQKSPSRPTYSSSPPRRPSPHTSGRVSDSPRSSFPQESWNQARGGRSQNTYRLTVSGSPSVRVNRL
ncbi:hypothetical protein BLNAU_7963 [Blattamonas nauphoetae]|uniref:Uncharacterized protein n=1 Tax=Blattamonas nauphoetae TaxID=2049346 RepID=A0ABQ9Y077_9EUKA|nr:hypothetical protein BLNAU_7963 [Blattamonas nauphoetae]